MTMRAIMLSAVGLLASAAAAFAADNHTVVLAIPVDVSGEPDIAQIQVSCYLNYPPGIVTDVYAAKIVKPVNGAFQGTVEVTLTAPDGMAPTGYRCGISLYPNGSVSGFTPAAKDVAPGSTLVTNITGVFPNARPLPRLDPRPY